MSAPSTVPARVSPRPRPGHEVPGRKLALLMVMFALSAGAGCGRVEPLAPDVPSGVAARSLAPVSALDPAPGQPLHLTGELGPGAAYVIDKPADWNGALVIWAHGYSAPTDPIRVPSLGPLLPFFLSHGFAVAASSYSENGYAVAEGTRQTHQLKQAFTDLVSAPDRTYIVGVSLGGIIGLKLVESFDRTYDGALLVSGVTGGSESEVRYLGDVWVLFDRFFPNLLPPLFGDRPGPFPQGPIVGAVTDPANAAAFQAFLAFARERGLPFASGAEAVQATVTALGFAWIGALDFLDRTHGHVLYDNTETVYTAAGVPQALVDQVNATVDRYEATPDAEAYLRQHYAPDGDLRIPVITLHDQRDPLVPFAHEQRFRETVAARGRLEWLRQYDASAFGHVSATLQGQIPARFLELVNWVEAAGASETVVAERRTAR